jgi:hypothetical protein
MQIQRCSRSHPVLSVALLAGLSLAAVASAQPPQQPTTFSGQLDIREREILVSLPTNLAKARLKPGDFQVLIDGQPREVSRAEPVSGGSAAPWTVLVYIDRTLASPGTAFSSEVALADHARDLARLGSVEVAVAGPEPGTVLSPSTEPGVIREKLADLADTARLERDHAAAGKATPPSDLQVRQQLDKLLAFLAAHHPAGPHILFLVADGLDLPAAQLEALAAAAPPPPADAAETPAAAFGRASRLLAAERWVVIPLAVHPESPGNPVSPQSEIDQIQRSADWSSHTNGPPPASLPARAPRDGALAYPGVVALATEPRLAPLRTLAEATAGTVIGYEVQLAPLFAELPHRWTIWVAEPEAPADDHLHSLTVRLPGRKADARAPQWLR